MPTGVLTVNISLQGAYYSHLRGTKTMNEYKIFFSCLTATLSALQPG